MAKELRKLRENLETIDKIITTLEDNGTEKEKLQELVKESEKIVLALEFHLDDAIVVKNEILSGIISEKLNDLKIPSRRNGYKYIKSAVMKLIKDPTLIKCMMKGLFEEIAQEFDTTSSKVSSGIRQAIEKSYIEGIDQYEFFGYPSINKQMTNKDFLVCLTGEVKRELSE